MFCYKWLFMGHMVRHSRWIDFVIPGECYEAVWKYHISGQSLMVIALLVSEWIVRKKQKSVFCACSSTVFNPICVLWIRSHRFLLVDNRKNKKLCLKMAYMKQLPANWQLRVEQFKIRPTCFKYVKMVFRICM